MGPHHLATGRALLRPVEAVDLEALHALWTEPGVRRYLWDDEIVARELTASVIERSLRQFAEEGHGLWLALDNRGGDLVGFCGFWYFHEPPQLELLYGVAASRWGHGVATELAVAMLRHGFETLGFERIQGSTDLANAASIRVMEKAGMRLSRRETAEGKDTVFFTLERPSFVRR